MAENIKGGRFFRSKQFERWLNRRLPPANSIELGQGNIFILPTREGAYVMILVFLMVLGGINYQNSLIFVLAFLLASLFMVGILHTFRNLSGLIIEAGSARPAFAGEDAEFQVIVSRQGARTYEAITIGWDRELMRDVDLIDDEEARVRVYVPTKRRGLLNPGRMLIETTYPLGLFRAWSWVDLNVTTLVYPRPIAAGEIPASESNTDEGEAVRREGADDFQGLRDFHDGDTLHHVAWRSYARTGELVVKEYAAFVDRRVWLDWAHLPGLDRENRLSRLCYWLLDVSKGNDEYGLRLPGIEIEPGRGNAHRDRLLRELALFEASP
ncbi:MAG: DUF58 domain-containing protein [Pseudomonadales bacterium]|nr:DUF58 domain-containing protein [Pseudomonadales bacterium]